MFELLNFLLSLLLIFCIINCLLIFISPNITYSILNLIIFIFVFSIILFCIGSDFFAFLLNMVYVGAVAVLFLFTIILLELRMEKFSPKKFLSFVIIYIITLCLGSLLISLVFSIYPYFSLEDVLYTSYTIKQVEYSSFLITFSQDLYNGYIVLILIVGCILLISLVGAVYLAYDYSKKRVIKYSNFSKK